MIFHSIRPRTKGMTDAGLELPAASGSGPAANFQTDWIRLSFAFGFLILLGVAAFVARGIAWNEAAVAFLHLLEVAAGGIAGLLFGERIALKGNVA
jgi:hypothetical protein